MHIDDKCCFCMELPDPHDLEDFCVKQYSSVKFLYIKCLTRIHLLTTFFVVLGESEIFLTMKISQIMVCSPID